MGFVCDHVPCFLIGESPGVKANLNLLIVEDQADLAANIWDYFSRRGHAVDHAADGVAGLRMSLAGRYHTVILDLGLPRMDGLVLCRQLREAGSGVPVIMLTARDTLEDKLKGFSEGADDYLVKPFALRELEARVMVLARQATSLTGQLLLVAGVSLDPSSMLLRREGRVIALTRTQARILECLMRRAPAVVAQTVLLREVWGPDEGDAAALHTHMYTLRGLVDKPFERPLLHTAHGIGYRFGDGTC